ncbi:MAG: hypothetical protein Q4F95_04710 [Oscillospiraceae bacterium]|nr:hypothetical protein [Oscillospiraceae bacterium]
MKTSRSIIAVLITVALMFSLNSCEQNMSRSEYASEVVTIYTEYSDKFEEIYEAVEAGQRVTAAGLCDEALDILKKYDDLKPPQVLKDEHEKIKQCCSDENEKISLQKELLELSRDTKELSEQQQSRLAEITNRMQELSSKSALFEETVDLIAGKELETQTTTDRNMLNQPGVEVDTD